MANESADTFVSVVICVHNAAPYLQKAIDSILRQTHEKFELLIINDGSTDGSREIALSFADKRIRVEDNPGNCGVVFSRNRGLELARAELVATQDADDISHPDRLRRQIDFMLEHPRVAVLGTAAQLIDAAGRQLPSEVLTRATRPQSIRWLLMFETPVIHSSVMARRSIVWDQLRGYDARFAASEDFELFSRAAAQYEVANLNEALVSYRSVPGSLSHRRKKEVVERVRAVLRENMKRYLEVDAPPDAFLDMWVRMHNPHHYARTPRTGNVVKEMLRLYQRFCEVNPSAVGEPEIRRHIVLSGVYLGMAHARRDPVGACANVLYATALDPRRTVASVTRLVASRVRRAGSSRSALAPA
jgi:glycosyltransferase involved in cell wall biosynthesis